MCHLQNSFTELLENEMSNLETNRKLANEKKSQLVKELRYHMNSNYCYCVCIVVFVLQCSAHVSE